MVIKVLEKVLLYLFLILISLATAWFAVTFGVR